MSEIDIPTIENIKSESDLTKEQVDLSALPINVSDGYKLPVAQQLVLLGVVLLLIFGTTITPHISAFLQHKNSTPLAVQKSENELVANETASAIVEKPFTAVQVTAQAAFVYDVTAKKVLFAKNETKVLPLASITKLMTALVAQEVLDEKAPVTINAQSIKQDGNSGLSEGEVFNRLTLSDLVLMSSSNDGAFALATAAGNVLVPNAGAKAFVEAMNIRAQELGLAQTHFKNPTGLDISATESGADGSANDIALLMAYIVEHEPNILTFTKEDQARMWSDSGEHHDAQNTNYYVDEIPGLLGSKTGYTQLAGGNLVVAFNAGLEHPIVAVVLGSTQQGRFTDILKLVDESQKYIAQNSK